MQEFAKRSVEHGLTWVLLFASLVGCGDTSPPAADEDERSEERRKEARCEAFATRRVDRVASQVNAVLNATNDMRPNTLPGAGNLDRHKLRGTIDKLERQCMGWADDVIGCIGEDGSVGPSCQDKIKIAMGDAAPQRPDTGSALTWTAKARGNITNWALAPNGTVLAVLYEDQGVVAIANGEEQWHLPGTFSPVLAPLPDGQWLSAGLLDAVAFDPATGTKSWTATIPPAPKDAASDFGAYENKGLQIVYAAGNGNAVVIADTLGRVFAVNPKRCAKGKKGCLKEEFDAIEELGGHTRGRLFLDDDGRRYAAGWDSFLVASPRGKPLAQMHARHHYTDARIRGDLVALALDDEIVGLDIANCSRKTPFGPAGELRANRARANPDQDPAAGAPPLKCRRWRTQVDDMQEGSMVVLDNGLVAVNAHRNTVAVQNGGQRWNVATGAYGPMTTDGTRLFLASHGALDDERPAFAELSVADGKELWRSSFGEDVSPSRVEIGGGLLVTAFDDQVFALKVPEPG